ncbi:Mov34/MPN/PAD-1 family protein [Alicyclobacillus fastidiosus]|uniref:Mov34/MPN/PAD-1 family protein n=1 Tax=Alicyclobacillus fastidiosus TaxID=392011 RepID=A0ABY6ZNW6_9BACL|nr:Mov34/MPN/PAD-1 family protein [Alicyclobacillus fastidiosus]WAH44268.1 Mov34/MPN/PAD-1 family protein [Alicyclobacillus fastidiosus]
MWSKSTCTNLLSSTLVLRLAEQAEAALPNECVGFIVRKGPRCFILPIPAIATQSRVYVHPQVLLDAAMALDCGGAELVATYHSHPDGTAAPSSNDNLFSAWSRTHVLLYRSAGHWATQVYVWSSPDCNTFDS